MTPRVVRLALSSLVSQPRKGSLALESTITLLIPDDTPDLLP